MSNKTIIISILLCALFCTTTNAQIKQSASFNTNEVESVTNALYCVLYNHDGTVLNIRNKETAPSLTGVTGLLMNPASGS